MKRKTIIICVVLVIVSLLLIGCKPQQTITEKVIYKADSTAITLLKTQLGEKTTSLEKATTDLERMRDEITTLRSTLSIHEINYDTTAVLKPDGYYPISHEVKTENTILYENSIKEKEQTIFELNKNVETLKQNNAELKSEINLLTNENKELQSKTKPTTGFNFRLFFIGVLCGALLVFAIRALIKNYL